MNFFSWIILFSVDTLRKRDNIHKRIIFNLSCLNCEFYLFFFLQSLIMNFIADAVKRMKYYKLLGEKTFEQLDDADFFYKPNGESNSIAIIIQHMYGNMMSRFTNFLTEDGEKAWRKRDAEFVDEQISRQDLLDLWNTGWATVTGAMGVLSDADLEKEITIRNEKLFVYDAVLRQLAHYPYHIGQIVFLGKMIKGDNWENLSVPKGGSANFNNSLMNKQV